MSALQIRDLPDEVHQTLRVRAAMEGKSLSEYVAGVLRDVAATPTLAEFSGRIKLRGRLGTATTDEVVAMIRAARDAR